ncbi:MAG: ParB/RepB/Spo0J family partition protein [Bacteroidetes bacterium]|nr:MAG: ParB/RepB/Spo0J family partition protein [Bacteroidota bacterium]
MSKKPALGRGLGSILPSNLPETKPLIQEIPLSQIEVNPFQPRTEFNEDALKELSESIRVHGIIQPITVRRLSERQYQLISGERRMRAAKLAGLQEVPAYVRTADDEQMLEMALIENIQREDLNPIEVALSYQRMIDELGLKQEELGDKVGKKRTTVTNALALLRLNADVQAALRIGDITTGHAKTMIGIDATLQQTLLREVISRQLSVRQTEQLAQELKAVKEKRTAPKAEAPAANPQQMHLNKVASQLEDKFGNKVRLSQGSAGKGEIQISFNSTEDLNRILEMLDL